MSDFNPKTPDSSQAQNNKFQLSVSKNDKNYTIHFNQLSTKHTSIKILYNLPTNSSTIINANIVASQEIIPFSRQKDDKILSKINQILAPEKI